MRWKLALILLVTIGCLAMALGGVEWPRARTALENTAWWTFGPVVICYLLAHAVRTLRLRTLLGKAIPFGSLFAINSIGFLSINVVPLRLGELVRPTLLAEKHAVSFGEGMAAIVLERLLDVAMLLFMLIGVTWWVELPQEGLVVRGIDVVSAGQRIAGTLLLAASVFAGILIGVGEPAIMLLERIPVVGRFGGFARRFREGMKSLLASPIRCAQVVAQTMTLWGLTLLGIGAFMWGFPGIPSSVGAVWTTWSITLAGMTAIPTPGFFGGYELFCTAALWLLGVDRDLGATFAITLHLGQFAFTCGLGGIFVIREGMSLRNLVVREDDTQAV